jgi:hypothetical protein
MKRLSIIVLIISGCFPQNQPRENPMVFEESTWIAGIYYRTIRDTIKVGEAMDISFYKKQFNFLYLLPDTLIMNDRKNKSIKTWAFIEKGKNLDSNWYTLYKYDEKGRLNNFFYSSCNFCSQFPIEYNITYKSTGDVERIFDNNNSNTTYHFNYDEKSEINKIDIYENGALARRISRIH